MLSRPKVTATVVLCSMAHAGLQAQGAELGPTVNPSATRDPVVHHHKAYARTRFGISCPGDRVVWVNSNSGIYHFEGERWFGRTKSGQYECEKAAEAEGDRETRNGQ